MSTDVAQDRKRDRSRSPFTALRDDDTLCWAITRNGDLTDVVYADERDALLICIRTALKDHAEQDYYDEGKWLTKRLSPHDDTASKAILAVWKPFCAENYKDDETWCGNAQITDFGLDVCMTTLADVRVELLRKCVTRLEYDEIWWDCKRQRFVPKKASDVADVKPSVVAGAKP